MKIKPIQNRVAIKLVTEEQLASGLFVPIQVQDKTQRGEIVAVGPGTQHEPMEVNVGDKVYFFPNSGTKVTVAGQEVVIMYARDILLIAE